MFRPAKQPSKLALIWMNLVGLTIGLKTPYGFRLRLPALMMLKQMNDELHSLRIKYDYTLAVNERQASSLVEERGRYNTARNDNAALCRAIKDLAKGGELSEETKAIIKGLTHG